MRTAHGLSTTRLSARLEDAGCPIPATGITRIEKGQRKVGIAELMALATVFDVNPMLLLQRELTITVVVK